MRSEQSLHVAVAFCLSVLKHGSGGNFFCSELFFAQNFFLLRRSVLNRDKLFLCPWPLVGVTGQICRGGSCSYLVNPAHLPFTLMRRYNCS